MIFLSLYIVIQLCANMLCWHSGIMVMFLINGLDLGKHKKHALSDAIVKDIMLFIDNLVLIFLYYCSQCW